jgi:hypothetical protein
MTALSRSWFTTGIPINRAPLGSEKTTRAIRAVQMRQGIKTEPIPAEMAETLTRFGHVTRKRARTLLLPR